MPKENLKRKALSKGRIKEGDQSRVISVHLENGAYWRVDVDRTVQKAAGGEYVDGNFVVVDPVEHMKSHGVWRERDAGLESLKQLVDDRRQILNLRNKVSNQIRAYERNTDSFSETTEAWLREKEVEYDQALAGRTWLVEKAVREFAKGDSPDARLAMSALGVRSVGPMTVAAMLTYVDISGVFPDKFRDNDGKQKPHPRAGQEKARHASSLWAYAGLDKPSHARYEKGVASGGNQTLRTHLYTLADSQVKGRGPYREVYDSAKDRLSKSEKKVKSRNTQGKLIECAWKDAKPSHRHGAALRKVMKAFLADWWFVGRTLHGLETSPLYADAMLGEGHRTISPRERGWEY